MFLTCILGFELKRFGVLQARLDELDELGTDGAINHAVILRKAQIHHLADNNLTLADNRPLGDLVHTQDRNLRKVDDGGRHDPSHGSQAGNREGSALKVL